MDIATFLIFNKTTGLPIFSHKFYEEADAAQEALLTGMLSAIQNLMGELNLGELNQINTKKYQIIGYQGYTYTFIIIGELDQKELITALLQDYAASFETLEIDNLRGLTENQRFIAEQMAITFKKVIDKAAFYLHIYRYTRMLGLEAVHAGDNLLVNAYLITYLRGLNDKEIRKEHVFYDVLYDESHIWGTVTTRADITYIVVLNFPKVDLSNIICFKHHFANISKEFLEQDFTPFEKALPVKNELQEILVWYHEKLAREISDYTPQYDLTQIENVLFVLQPIMPQILSTVFSGKPIAILADRTSTEYVIDLLVYATNFSDASLDPNQDIYKRFTRCEEKNRKEYEQLNYAILDVENLKLTHATTFRYFTSACETQKELESIRQRLENVRKICMYVHKNVEVLMKYRAKGADINITLENTEDEEKELLSAMINWINPSILTNRIQEINDQNW